MPRFFLPIIILNVVSVVLLIPTLLFLSPSVWANRFIFLGLLQTVLTLALSLIFYQVAIRKASVFTEPRYLYRKLLRRAFLITAVLTFLLGFKFWGGLTPFNILLLVVFLGVVEIYFSYRH